MIIQRQALLLKVFPVEVFVALSLFHHGDTIFNGANQLAEVAPNAFLFFNGVGVIRLAPVELDRLV